MPNQNQIKELLSKMTEDSDSNLKKIKKTFGSLEYLDESNQSLLHIFVDDKYDENACFLAIKTLLQAGLSPNLEDEFNYNFIQTALYAGYSEEFILKILEKSLDYNLDVNHVDSDKDTIVHTAIYSDDYLGKIENIYTLLCNNGFDSTKTCSEGRNLVEAMCYQQQYLKTGNYIKQYTDLQISEFKKLVLSRNTVSTISERITELVEQPVPTLNLTNIESIIEFGNDLNQHADFIYKELPNLEVRDTIETSVSIINNAITDLSRKTTSIKYLISLFLKFIGRKNKGVDHAYVLERVGTLKSMITSYIKEITLELTQYDLLRQYMEEYQAKCEEYLEVITNEQINLSIKYEESERKNDANYFNLLNQSRYLKILEDKRKRFILSNQVIEQQLLKINQSMLTHLITLDSLEITKNDLLPLITSELLIAKGRKTKTEALNLSRNVFCLLQAVLNENIQGTKEIIEKMKNTTFGNDIYQLLKQDIDTYLNCFQVNKLSLSENTHTNLRDNSNGLTTSEIDKPSLNNSFNFELVKKLK